jgi:hypothetical protein
MNMAFHPATSYQQGVSLNAAAYPDTQGNTAYSGVKGRKLKPLTPSPALPCLKLLYDMHTNDYQTVIVILKGTIKTTVYKILHLFCHIHIIDFLGTVQGTDFTALFQSHTIKYAGPTGRLRHIIGLACS